MPHAVLQPGVRLRVPFGRREVVGVLVEVVQHSEVPADKLKPALQLLDCTPRSAYQREALRCGSASPGRHHAPLRP